MNGELYELNTYAEWQALFTIEYYTFSTVTVSMLQLMLILYTQSAVEQLYNKYFENYLNIL